MGKVGTVDNGAATRETAQAQASEIARHAEMEEC